MNKLLLKRNFIHPTIPQVVSRCIANISIPLRDTDFRRQVFCNVELKPVDYVGFDMDFTLAQVSFKSREKSYCRSLFLKFIFHCLVCFIHFTYLLQYNTEFDKLAFEGAKQKLHSWLGYPKEVLDFKYE